jgi:hypothetical protein
MDLTKCEHCGNTFLGNSEARLCPLCKVAEKAREKAVTRIEYSDRQLPMAA